MTPDEVSKMRSRDAQIHISNNAKSIFMTTKFHDI